MTTLADNMLYSAAFAEASEAVGYAKRAWVQEATPGGWLCDHLLTQEPPFVLLVLVAYVAQLAEGPLPCVRIAPLLLPGTI